MYYHLCKASDYMFSYYISPLLLFSTLPSCMVTRHCTVAGGKVTSSMLLKDANFSSIVSNHGGKGLVSVLRKEAGKLGLGGDAASRDVFWRVNAKGRPCVACGYACL